MAKDTQMLQPPERWKWSDLWQCPVWGRPRRYMVRSLWSIFRTAGRLMPCGRLRTNQDFSWSLTMVFQRRQLMRPSDCPETFSIKAKKTRRGRVPSKRAWMLVTNSFLKFVHQQAHRTKKRAFKSRRVKVAWMVAGHPSQTLKSDWRILW